MIALRRGLITAAALASALALMAAAPRAHAQQQRATFPHDRHANVFPLCTTCHAGIVRDGAPVFPDPARCTACHDGTVEVRVAWQPRVGPRPGNRKFTHAAHNVAATAKRAADSTLINTCSACHVEGGAQRMSVRPAVITQCFSCHQTQGPHVDAPGDACARCHVRLSDAPLLTPAAIARFPKPSSHNAPGFRLGGHGKLARVPNGAGQGAIASSCATCHARNLCVQCHVNAPESPVIRALALDDRVPTYTTTQPVPVSHADRNFARAHGALARSADAPCATCHVRETCLTCHVNTPPAAVLALAVRGPGRAPGAHVQRAKPQSHVWDFPKRHGPEANARPQSCETCHTRETCLSCHRPEYAKQSSYHDRAFLSRHPSAAYSREARCTECHNTAQFCQSCHQRSGLVAGARLGRAGYHDAFRGFSLGHGQAARQSLESCVGCHAERDCAACHSATGGGYGFNPHGPGFNAARLKSKNPSLCVACHGTGILKGQ